MNLAIIGATGRLGGAIATEATTRGHRVTAVGSRDVDVTDPASITSVVAGHDAVVVSVKGDDRLVPRAAQALLQALPPAGVPRLVFVGGGGSLEYAPGQRFVDAPTFPPQYLQTALDQAEALAILRTSAADGPVEWSYASPPPVHLVPGDRTGRYRVAAGDTPLTDEHGESRVTIGDFACAVVDTAERASFVRQRFTVAY
jgi:putative NADH-flavin reductase